MKRRAAWVFVLTGILGLVVCSSAGTRPYQDLTAEEVTSMTVLLQPPDKTLQVEGADRLIELLQDVVICEEAPSYTGYTGQAVTIRSTMSAEKYRWDLHECKGRQPTSIGSQGTALLTAGDADGDRFAEIYGRS